ncbi:bacterio-opsin activator domain-containing protein [Halalkalicoccus paucihalophilus]|uniref:bacterio-opsin activator domain-containing protein n=1 Tax=Halalkalicoccus paucihalophilus TaxID=1008153 RepID=UPI00082CAAA4|nr:bacterio-opsin activator domain-containing protein [Halalkalicoccus paucihalophilus]
MGSLAVHGGEDVTGYILVMLRQQAALFADQAVELVFRSEAFAQPFVEVTDEEIGQITIDHLIRLADESILVYLTEPEQKITVFLKVIQGYLTVEHVRQVETGTPTQQFEIKVSGDQPYSLAAEYGGRIQKVMIEDIEYQMVVVFPPHTDIRRVVEGFQDSYSSLELVSQRSTRNSEIASVGLQDVLETQLTDRQRSVLEVAFYAGYFDWPRRSTGEEIASSFDITDSTFQEHLRLGTRKVLEAVLEKHRRIPSQIFAVSIPSMNKDTRSG